MAMFSAAVASTTLGARFPTQRVLRIRTRTDDTRPDVERGLAFGFAEAKRSASLFGWNVERIDVGDADAFLTAIASAADVPTLLLVYDSEPAANAFCLAPSSPTATSDTACRVEAWHHDLERFGA